MYNSQQGLSGWEDGQVGCTRCQRHRVQRPDTAFGASSTASVRHSYNVRRLLTKKTNKHSVYNSRFPRLYNQLCGCVNVFLRNYGSLEEAIDKRARIYISLKSVNRESPRVQFTTNLLYQRESHWKNLGCPCVSESHG